MINEERNTALYQKMFLAIAFLVSPMGLPMFAVRILGILQSFSHFLRAT